MTTESQASSNLAMGRRRSILERPHTRAKIIEYVLQGMSDEKVAKAIASKRVHPSRQAITAFRHRHAEELGQLTKTIEKQIEDYAISSKVERIAALNGRWLRGLRLIEARANDQRYQDEPGYNTGLMVHQVKSVGSGPRAILVDVYVTDTALLAEIRAMEEAAATELGQLPRAADIQIGDRNLFVLEVVPPNDHDGDVPRIG